MRRVLLRLVKMVHRELEFVITSVPLLKSNKENKTNKDCQCYLNENSLNLTFKAVSFFFLVSMMISQNVPKSHHRVNISWWAPFYNYSVQFSSVAQSCPTLCDPMNSSTPGLSVHHKLLEFTQTHVHQVGDAIQPSHPLWSPSPPAPNASQHQNLFQWVNSSHEVAKVLEFQLQHQSFQWTPRTDIL